MAHIFADNARDTTATTGTGSLTLAGAVAGSRSITSVMSTGDTCDYRITDGVAWEVGIGTFTAPSTLARTTILSSSNSGLAISLGAGSKEVFITLPATKVSAFNTNALYPDKVLQIVTYVTSAYATGTTVMPVDDSIPQNTEGDEYMTCAITPKSADSYLRVEVQANIASPTDNALIATALFRDTTANAVAAIASKMSGLVFATPAQLRHKEASGSTTETTFKVRIGCGSAGTVYLNGMGGARIFGGVCESSITITEYLL